MIRYYRLSGGGNDFLALVGGDGGAGTPAAETIRAWCTRGLSLGADGLFVLTPAGGGAAMAHFNADGHATELCLNGTRCAAQLAHHLGWAGEELTVETGAGPVRASVESSSSVALTLPAPEQLPRALELSAGVAPAVAGWLVRVGVPHFVTLWPGRLGDAPVAELGPPLRSHPDLGPAGANVDFVRFPARDRLEIRSYERGVEGETLACGTGVLASAAAGAAAGLADLPLTALTLGGFELRVGGRVETGRIAAWTLAGDARLVAEGALHPAAGELPDPPDWS